MYNEQHNFCIHNQQLHHKITLLWKKLQYLIEILRDVDKFDSSLFLIFLVNVIMFSLCLYYSFRVLFVKPCQLLKIDQ